MGAGRPLSDARLFGRPRRARRLRPLVLLVVLATATAGAGLVWVAPRAREVVRTYVYEDRVRKHRATIAAASRESGVDPYLLAGVMIAESSGRVGAKSPKGALGLFQLMPTTAGWRAEQLGLEPPDEATLLSDALLNARLAANYLAWLLERADGNVERSLVAYNLGPTRLSKQMDAEGGWEAWRARREQAGDSQLLAYVAKVLRWRDRVRADGLFETDPGSDARDHDEPPGTR